MSGFTAAPSTSPRRRQTPSGASSRCGSVDLRRPGGLPRAIEFEAEARVFLMAEGAPATISELERRMRPGVFSQAGFLGADERLPDLLACDAETMRSLGLSFDRTARELERLIRAAANHPRRRARVAPHFVVTVSVSKGFQICPWAPQPHAGQCTEGGGAGLA